MNIKNILKKLILILGILGFSATFLTAATKNRRVVYVKKEPSRRVVRRRYIFVRRAPRRNNRVVYVKKEPSRRSRRRAASTNTRKNRTARRTTRSTRKR